jgi:hypothetical protein
MSGVADGEFDDGDHVAFQFNQHSSKINKDGQIPRFWILLDNQSTVDVFLNEDLLDDIRDGDGYMDIHCNASTTNTNQVGNLPGYGKVWYNPNEIENILLLSRVKERGFRVTFDSTTGYT